MGIADEKYVALTTFRKNGERKTGPVWIAELGDGTLGFTTSSSSWKVKRLGNDPRVELQPCDSRGNPRPDSDVVTGTAKVVHDGDFESVRASIKDKYGIQVTVIKVLAKLGTLIGRDTESDAAVIISPDG